MKLVIGLLAGILAVPSPSAPAGTPPDPGGERARAPGARAVHTVLVSSHPADGDTLAAPPDTFRLTFSQPVGADLARAVVVDPEGREHPLALRADPGDARSLIAGAPAGLPAGGHRLVWRVVSADGHPVTGELAFHLRSGAEPAVADTGGPAGGGPADTGAAGGPAPSEGGAGALAADGPPVGLLAALRGLGLAAVLGLAGLLCFRAWIAPGGGAAGGDEAGPARPGAGALLLAVLSALLLAAHLWLWAQRVAPPGPGSAGASLLAAVATPTGTAEAVRTALALLAVWAVGLARRVGLAALLALAAVVVGAAAGHGADEGAVFLGAKALHLVALALWIGGLIVLATGRGAGPAFAARAHRVSAVALVAVLAVTVTGAVQTWILLPDLGSLASSAYGRLVLAKVAGLGVLIAFGAYHRFRLLPALGAEGASAEGEGGSGAAHRLRRSVRRETAVQFAVVLVAGFLAYTPPPDASGVHPSEAPPRAYQKYVLRVQTESESRPSARAAPEHVLGDGGPAEGDPAEDASGPAPASRAAAAKPRSRRGAAPATAGG